jgi:PKHD-type hydroxylase
MAFLSIWYETHLPEDIIASLEKDLTQYDENLQESVLHGNIIDKKKRNSKNTWIPTSHWIGGFVWHYIQRANTENFCYDITHIENESIQYTQYNEGEFYGWHIDAGLDTYMKPQSPTPPMTISNCEYTRKLSFIIQLSNSDDYTGGDVQFLDNNDQTYFIPRTRGSVIVFDSRSKHRVRTVKSGMRKSLVGWVMGPRFR